MDWPTVTYNEEAMREVFGIEDPGIPLDTRVDFLNALSETGLRRISIGAFVSPRFVPQMADFQELLKRVQPREGVKYLTFLHNKKARTLAEQFSPPLTIEDELATLFIDICDVHQRRNVNRSIAEAMQGWPEVILNAQRRGIARARVGIASAWGSNFLGKFSQDYRLSFLGKQIDLFRQAGMEVVELGLHDSQSWCLPYEMEEDLKEIKKLWPEIKCFHLHMHNARAMALPSIYVALRTLSADDTVILDGTLGGMGGGQYCGNGRASGMAATEDLLHMLEGMGIETGVDLDKVIECVWMLERILGRPSFGHVSKAGPRPTTEQAFYDPNIPAVETLEAAKHFKIGPSAYEKEGYSPWKQPITGPYYQGS